ncbi:hypothetical protein [Streptomyces zaomyceticus]|uniref:hypothetical protein n=1 Tax=Streptomyces zaomyceticus TaxID=68286 RepID=UPI002E1F426B
MRRRLPRLASVLTAGAAALMLGTLGFIGSSDATLADYAPQQAAPASPLAAAYDSGWQAGVKALGDGTAPTFPNVTADSTDPGTLAWVDGWAAGQAAALGDDNGDGRVDEDESGWDCRTMGNGLCGSDVPAECERAGEVLQLCVAVTSRPPYGWTNPDGSRVDNPDGRTQVRDLDETPGTPEWADALQALDAEYREHGTRR